MNIAFKIFATSLVFFLLAGLYAAAAIASGKGVEWAAKVLAFATLSACLSAVIAIWSNP